MAEAAPTVSRDALLQDGTDRAFRDFLHQLLAFSARLEAVRSGFARRLGLPGAAYTTLIGLSHLKRQMPEVGVKVLAEHLHVSPPSVTAEVNRLVQLRLVTKRNHPTDGRRVLLALTAKGEALLRQLQPVQAPVNDALFGALAPADFRRFGELLPRMVADGDAALALLQTMRESER